MEKSLVQMLKSPNTTAGHIAQKVALILLFVISQYPALLPASWQPDVIGGLVAVVIMAQFSSKIITDISAGDLVAVVSDVKEAVDDFKSTVGNAIDAHGMQLGALNDTVNQLIASGQQAAPAEAPAPEAPKV